MRLLLLALLSSLLLPARAAHAGGCPTCAADSDCAADAFCVVHDSDVGCGAQRSLCCPGQGCSAPSGRPSCEQPGTCAVMCGNAADCTTGGAGGTCVMSPSSPASWCQFDDGTCPSGRRWGASAGDGLKGQCLASDVPDAAPGAPDAAPPGTPDGAPGTGSKNDGCGCRVGERSADGTTGGLALAALVLLAFGFGSATRRARA